MWESALTTRGFFDLLIETPRQLALNLVMDVGYRRFLIDAQ